MNPLEYLHLQLRLEGKEVINGNLLRQVEDVPDEDMPLMAIASLTSDKLVFYYDEALLPEIRAELDKKTQIVQFPNIDSIIEILETQTMQVEVGHYKTYKFPERYKDLNIANVIPYSGTDPKIQAFNFGNFTAQVHAIEQAGKIVSACVSAKENDLCGEAWVYTDPEHRHQGLARKVVSAWAASLFTEGKVPFYSHKIQNIASANLAMQLGLHPIFEEITLTRSAGNSD